MAVAIELSPAAQQIEGWLRKRGQDPTFDPAFPVGDIDIGRSQKNQARLINPLDEELVAQYAIDMKAGDEFPPIVVWADRKGNVLISGIHRTMAALEANIDTLPAWVVTPDTQAQVSVLTYEANTTHGKATAIMERVQQAMFLIDTGVTATDAAKLLHVAPKDISRYTRIREGRERLKRGGFKRPDRITDTRVERLAALRADDVLMAAANLMKDADLTFEAVNELVVEVNKHRSDADQLATVEKERKRQQNEIQAKMGGAIKLPRSIVRISSVVGSAAKLPSPSAKDLKLVPLKYRQDLLAKIKQSQERLSEIAVGLRVG
jgi:predicted transcriptional regulator